MDLVPIDFQRGHLEKCVDTHLSTALTGDKDINEDTRIWPAEPGCTVNCIHTLDKLFLKSQTESNIPLQTGSRPENVRANCQKRKRKIRGQHSRHDPRRLLHHSHLRDVHRHGAIKKVPGVKANDLTWEKLKDIAEVYKRATTLDNKAMIVNSNKIN